MSTSNLNIDLLVFSLGRVEGLVGGLVVLSLGPDVGGDLDLLVGLAGEDQGNKAEKTDNPNTETDVYEISCEDLFNWGTRLSRS